MFQMIFQLGFHQQDVSTKCWYDFVKRHRMVTVEYTVTQEDQDKADEEKQRESIHSLVQSWLDSLQLISVIVSELLTVR